MVSLGRHFPLPFTCQHESYSAGPEDDHGNATPTWSAPVSVPCAWWVPSSVELSAPPTGGDRVAADAVVVVEAAVLVDHRDRFVIDGRRFEVVGMPKDYNHNPYGYSPDRVVVELKWVG